jgi:Sulfotransferase family
VYLDSVQEQVAEQTGASMSVPAREGSDALAEYELLCRARVDHRVPVREPLVLISQVQRSGGTLLSQLFDGHPECHAHPHELLIGHPKSTQWPALDLAAPETWFSILQEEKVARHFRSGYKKPAEKPGDDLTDVFPFLFPPGLQRLIFDSCLDATKIERERDVLDCYFTSYFNAWLDNHNLYTGPKRVVTAFAPRLIRSTPSVEAFFADYPDGTLLSIVREPRAWFASARLQEETYGDVEHALKRWRRSVEAGLTAAERYGDRVVLLTYEQLVLDTEATMRDLAERLGLTISPALLTPSFNGRPIRANSSYAVDQHGVLADRVDVYRRELDADTIARIDELAGDLYDRVR